MTFRVLNAVTALAIILAAIAPAVAAPLRASAAAAPQRQPTVVPPSPTSPQVPSTGRPTLREHMPPATGGRSVPATKVYGETDPGGDAQAIYIVQLAAAPLASYRGGLPGLAVTSPQLTGASLDMGRAADEAYAVYLAGQQSSALASIEQMLGRTVTVKFNYQAAFNGFALELTPKEAAQVVAMPGVLRVQRDFIDQPQTDYGPAWIDAPAVWTGSGSPQTLGEGVVVGVLDTGINVQSPSFARVGGDNYIAINPRGRFYGVCDPSSSVFDPAFMCQEKLIGAWDFADGMGGGPNNEFDGPADNDGHGSHTASTAAGNFVAASLVASTIVVTANVSGVAPHANIIAYDVCLPAGCPGSALVAGLNQAVLDGVDVINYSIGGGSRDPWQSADALAMLSALDAGVFVAVSAGNEGPTASTIGSPANAPWVTAAGASTHNRRFVNQVTNLTSSVGPLADISGQSITGGTGPAPIVDAAALGDPLCSAPFAPDTLAGKIVLCERGVNARVDKGANVLAGGAAGMILMNEADNGSSLIADAHVLPAVHITYAAGAALRTWLASGTNHSGIIGGTTKVVDDAFGDIVASFSSRGPDATSPDVIKPDVTAPGVDIMAASNTGGDFMVLSGTSMASPHLAGAAALLMAQHPDWSPAEVRSALMLAASGGVRKEDGTAAADAFDAGAGRLDLDFAARVGFVLDESAYTFETANPVTGGEPTALNLASLANSSCIQTCTWTRTVRSVLGDPVSYTVTPVNGAGMAVSVQPSAFDLGPGATQVLTITADVSAAPVDRWAFGAVAIRHTAGLPAPSASLVNLTMALPLAARARTGAAPAGLNEIRIDTRRSAGAYTLSGLRAVTTPALVKKLYVGSTEVITGTIAPDPTNNNPWDVYAGGIYTQLITISDPSTALLAVQIVDTTAVDLDLYVGYDADGNGQPSADEVLCQSASASARELCELPEPGAGVFWLLLQNWESSGAPFDTFTMIITKVAHSGESPQFQVTGPPATTLGVPFAVSIHWALPGLHAGGIMYGLLELGTSPGQPDNIVSLPVKLIRLGDDVQVESSADPNAGKFVRPGELVDYAIRVHPEPTAPNPTDYVITATIPAGMVYVPGQGRLHTSAGTTSLDPAATGSQVIWNLQGVVTAPRYVQSTNDPTSPLFSSACKTPFGGYVHLEDFGIPLQSAVEGDGRTWAIDAFYGGTDPYSFFGGRYPQLYFSDDAALSVVGLDPHLNSGVNAPIPSPALPNNLLAPLWGNFKVVYDEAAGTGVRIAGAGNGALMFLEYDGLQSAAGSGAGGSIDVEAIVSRAVDPFGPEIIFAYDRAAGTLPPTVTGLENATGTSGVAYDDPVGADGHLICYDWTADELVLTYGAQVGDNAPLDTRLDTSVASSLTAPETEPAFATAPVFVAGVELAVAQTGPSRVSPGVPITYTLTVANNGKAAASNLSVLAQLPLGSTHLSGGGLLPNGEGVSFALPSLAAGAQVKLNYSVALDTPTTAAFNAAGVQSPAIIGGHVAADGAWPWQAALWNNATDSWYGCGGSLIAPGWVLTAAHCVADAGGLVQVPASALSVVLGVNDLTKVAQGQRIPVTQVIANPQFSVVTDFDADVALLRLAHPAELNAKVQVVPLVTPFDAGLYVPEQPSVVTGWGTLTAGLPVYPDQLYQVEVPIVEQNTCRFAYAATGAVVNSNMLCAGLPQGGKDSCQGDSGGPLVVRAGSRWKQAGIVSWGNGCAEPGLPGVYTRLANYLQYVSDVQNTLTTRAYFVADTTGLPGHSSSGTNVITTLVKPVRAFLPIVGKR
ncbi:MAG: trypsin-like serine protease [Caldilineaceae bacterium]